MRCDAPMWDAVGRDDIAPVSSPAKFGPRFDGYHLFTVNASHHPSRSAPSMSTTCAAPLGFQRFSSARVTCTRTGAPTAPDIRTVECAGQVIPSHDLDGALAALRD